MVRTYWILGYPKTGLHYDSSNAMEYETKQLAEAAIDELECSRKVEPLEVIVYRT